VQYQTRGSVHRSWTFVNILEENCYRMKQKVIRWFQFQSEAMLCTAMSCDSNVTYNEFLAHAATSRDVGKQSKTVCCKSLKCWVKWQLTFRFYQNSSQRRGKIIRNKIVWFVCSQTSPSETIPCHGAYGDILILQKYVSSVVKSLQNGGVYNNQTLDNWCRIKKKA